MRGCRGRNILLAAALALAALATAFAGSARAADLVVPRDSGLTAPAGIVVTPDGKLWVADELFGVCRVAATAGTEPAQHGRLVLDRFCAPEPADPLPGTPAPDPLLAERPSGAFQMAFDTAACAADELIGSDARCNFYVAEGTSGGSGVWRMHWNRATGTIDAAWKIYSDPIDLRVTGLALSPSGDVHFSTKRDATIRRLTQPQAATAFAYPNPPSVGQSRGPAAASLAHLGQALYLADGGRLTKIAVPSPTGSGGGTAVEVGGVPADAVVSAVAADAVEGRVYAGTNSDKLVDSVYAVTDDGAVPAPPAAEYDTGFANVTAVTVAGDGGLYIGDDAAVAAGVVNTFDQARIFHRAKSSMDLPRVTFTARPRDPAPGTDPTALAIRFQSRPLATFECQFGQAVLAVVACDSATPGTGEYTPAALAEGTYQFKVRATDASDTGPWATLGFAVDNTAPTLSLDPNAPSTAVGGAIRLGFSANEIGTAFECRIDGGEFQRCSSPKSYAGLALGEHTVEVRGTDAAGNAATNTLTWDFTSVPAPVQPDTSTGQAPPVIPVVPTLGAPAPGRSAVPAPAAPAAPIAVQASLREPRQAIGVPCVAVSPSRQRARFRLSGIDALISFRAPSQARYAKFTLRRSSSRGRSAGVVETVGYAKVRVAGSGHTTRVALTRGQRSRVRSGRLRLAISYGTCRTQVGEWEWLTTSIREGSNR